MVAPAREGWDERIILSFSLSLVGFMVYRPKNKIPFVVRASALIRFWEIVGE